MHNAYVQFGKAFVLFRALAEIKLVVVASGQIWLVIRLACGEDQYIFGTGYMTRGGQIPD